MYAMILQKLKKKKHNNVCLVAKKTRWHRESQTSFKWYMNRFAFS